RVCKAHPRVQVAGMMFTRYSPGFYTARQLIASGALGGVRLIESRKTYKLGNRPSWVRRWEAYGGSIAWIGSHAIDWTDFLAGLPMRRVYASQSSRHNAGFGTMETSALIHLTLDGATFASVAIDVFRPQSAATHGDDWARVVGTAGVLEIRPMSVHLLTESDTAPVARQVACDRMPLDDFVRATRGERPGLIGTEDTLRLADACLRAVRSADEGRVIDFD
ncbi:MAG TPA: Gfo/Idh/MocA family oxidoreductase, partial [Tepidisphaeraceae bacterium]|nr:Gfo/Idh/MocA family oxidoreductase [Tepidisphaeraceae bacterium]